jgi:ISXO2-like transposase domain
MPIRPNASHEAHVMTDSTSWYKHMNRDGMFAGHDRIDHMRGEYGRHEPGKPHTTTITVEGYFSLFKRRMRGVYQNCAEKHLHIDSLTQNRACESARKKRTL